MRRGFDDRLWALYLAFLMLGLVLFGVAALDDFESDLLALAVVLEMVALAFAGAAYWKGADRSR